VTATGPRLSAGLKALDQRPSTGAIERYFYFSCCLLAALGDRAAKGASPAALARKRPPVRLWQTSGKKGGVEGHVRRMGQNIAVVVGAGLIAMAIMVTNHWATIPGGKNSIAATIRLNRWTGSIDVCSLNAKSVSGSNASGLQLTCEVQKSP
jgi:hypothetical protein